MYPQNSSPHDMMLLPLVKTTVVQDHLTPLQVTTSWQLELILLEMLFIMTLEEGNTLEELKQKSLQVKLVCLGHLAAISQCPL